MKFRNKSAIMSSSRVIRGTKAKVFLYVCAILIITGLIACYNNTLSELDDIKKSNEICQQQQENLSTQLQVISDYKQKLEKSLKNEKAEHQYSKRTLEDKITGEKLRNEKISSDAVMKYNSLQQHYNLLKTEQDDFKEESGKIQQKQLEEINSLQSKLKEVKEELKKVQTMKENLMTRYTELELEMQKLKVTKAAQEANEEDKKALDELMTRYHVLEEKFDNLQKKCDSPNTLQMPLLEGQTIFESPDKVVQSSSAKSSIKPSSKAVLHGVPLPSPSVTPQGAKKESNLKLPLRVPEIPENKENQNEHPEIMRNTDQKKVDDAEKDNGALEVIDPPGQQNININEVDLQIPKIGDAEKHKNDDEYKGLQDDGDDDPDDYADNDIRREEQAVRN